MKDTQAERVFMGSEERLEQELTKLTHEESLIQSNNWKAGASSLLSPNLPYNKHDT